MRLLILERIQTSKFFFPFFVVNQILEHLQHFTFTNPTFQVPQNLRNYDAKSVDKSPSDAPSLHDYIVKARSLSREGLLKQNTFELKIVCFIFQHVTLVINLYSDLQLLEHLLILIKYHISSESMTPRFLRKIQLIVISKQLQ